MSTRRTIQSTSSEMPSLVTIFVGVVFVGIIGAIGLSVFGAYAQRETTTTVVVDKERVCRGDGDGGTTCEYLIFTEDGTYKVTDSLIIGRWNSSDIYGRIKRCHRYEIVSRGFRFGWTSDYPNIEDVTDLGRVDGCES